MRFILSLFIVVLIIAACKKEEPNKPPVASFTISPERGDTDTVFIFDASDCTDEEDDNSMLKVRWDFQSDSIWDTEFSAIRLANHQFTEDGIFYIKMEVKDSEGLTSSLSKELAVSKDSIIPDPVVRLLYPYQDEIILDSTITFSWSSSGDLNHTVKIGTTSQLELNYETRDTFLQLSSLKRNTEYFWMILGEDKSGNSVSTDVRSFYISADQNEKVVFLNPDPSDKHSAYTVPEVFSCEVIGNKEEFKKYIFEAWQTPSEFDRIIENNEPRFIMYEKLEVVKDLFWRISVIINGKLISGPVWQITKSETGYPKKPFDPSPADGKIIQSNSAVLSWNCGLDDPMEFWRVIYKVFVGPDPGNLELVSTQSRRDYTLNDLREGQVIYWKIDAQYETFHTEGDIWTFSVKPRVPTWKAYNTNPKPGVILYKVPDTWTWYAEDPDNGDLSYDVYFGEYPDISRIHSGLSSPQMPTPAVLEPGKQYQWRIDVIDDQGNKTTGENMFIFSPPPYILKRINHYRSDTIYEYTDFEYDDQNRPISNIRQGYVYHYQKYPWIYKDSLFYSYDGFNRLSQMTGMTRTVSWDGWQVYYRTILLGYQWENDTLLRRLEENGNIRDIFVHDKRGRLINFYYKTLDSSPYMSAQYQDGYLPEHLIYIYNLYISGGYIETWDQSMIYDGHQNPDFYIPYPPTRNFDWNVRGAPTDFAENIVQIDRNGSWTGEKIINYIYEYNSSGFVIKKYEEGKKAEEYWEYIYD